MKVHQDGSLNTRTLYKPWREVRYQSCTLPTNYILRQAQDRPGQHYDHCRL